MADDNLNQQQDTNVPGGQPAQWQAAFEQFKTTDPEVWQSLEKRSEKDLPTFVKSAVHLEKRLGQSLVPPGKDAKPEDRAAFNKKLTDLGFLPQIPESPDKYDLKLDAIPENLRNQELISEFKTFAYQNGIAPEVANKLLELNAKQFTMANQLFEADRAAAETRIGELLKTEGRALDDSFMENGHRAAEFFLKNSPQTLEKINQLFGNDPDVMYFFSKMGEVLGEDTSMLGETPVSSDGKTAQAEADDIMKNPANPKHELFLKGDKATHEYVQSLYARAFPGQIQV